MTPNTFQPLPRVYDYDPRISYRRRFAEDMAKAKAARQAGKSPHKCLQRCAHWRGGIADWNADFKARLAVVITDLAYPHIHGDYTLLADLDEAEAA